MIRLRNIQLTADEKYSISKTELHNNYTNLIKFIANKYKIPYKNISKLTLVKESIDARKKPTFIITVDISFINDGIEKEFFKKHPNSEKIILNNSKITNKPYFSKEKIVPLIVGMGPAGIFSALTFLENSITPIIIERGSSIDSRVNDVDIFISQKILKENSNIQFGEGGAGTFSDAKLSTGISSELVSKILKTFVSFGAPEEILYKSLPHIGTDIIRRVIKNIREYLISQGAKISFNTKLIDFDYDNSGIISAKCINTINDSITEFSCNKILLCIGHSARDTMELLYNKGILMEQKSFAIGVRIEHLQEDVNKSRYHELYNHPSFKAASYKLNVKTPDNRGVYTFCMCPGGEVVLASSEPKKIVVNGMSYFNRDNTNSNSALLVGVRPSDFESNHPLAGIWFQRKIEQLAYELSNKTYCAPVQTVGNFLNNEYENTITKVVPSCKNSYLLSNLKYCLPDFVTKNISYALPFLSQKMPCFADNSAILTAVESRSSSPVKIIRDENYECTIKGLYGAGEGSGFAGGIMSSAVDGIKVVNKICGVNNEYKSYNI